MIYRCHGVTEETHLTGVPPPGVGSGTDHVAGYGSVGGVAATVGHNGDLNLLKTLRERERNWRHKHHHQRFVLYPTTNTHHSQLKKYFPDERSIFKGYMAKQRLRTTALRCPK